MSPVELKFLIMLQIAMDVGIIVLFVFLIRRAVPPGGEKSLEAAAGVFESLLSDAEAVTDRLREEIREKERLLEQVNEKLDMRVSGLKRLLERAEALVPLEGEAGLRDTERAGSCRRNERKILLMADDGIDPGTIAERLSIPRDEVAFVLDLSRKRARPDTRERPS